MIDISFIVVLKIFGNLHTNPQHLDLYAFIRNRLVLTVTFCSFILILQLDLVFRK